MNACGSSPVQGRPDVMVLVDARGREQGEEQQGAAGAARKAAAGRSQGAPGEAGPGVAAAWRQQLLDTLYMVGTLCGVVRLLAACPRVRLGTGPGGEQPLLRALLPPGVLAAVPSRRRQKVHAAFRGTAPAAGHGQGQGGQGGGGGNDRALAARRCVRLLLGKGGPLELDGGAWVGSEGSCFWRVLTGGLEGAGEAREAVVREAAERAGHLVGLLVPGEEAREIATALTGCAAKGAGTDS